MNKAEKLKEILGEMTTLQGHVDTEMAHHRADELLCKALMELGQFQLVDEFLEVNRWYA